MNKLLFLIVKAIWFSFATDSYMILFMITAPSTNVYDACYNMYINYTNVMIQCQFHSNADSTIKPTNRIQRQLHSKRIQTLNPNIGFNVNSIQRQIQPLNPQI